GRGEDVKWRALRLDTGNFSWGNEAVTRKATLLDVVCSASNNELGAITQIDVAPFKQYYLQHYGLMLVAKKKSADLIVPPDETECKVLI
ncbi:hypothetical protein RJ640_022297, partial [Escallonia rubra]